MTGSRWMFLGNCWEPWARIGVRVALIVLLVVVAVRVAVM